MKTSFYKTISVIALSLICTRHYAQVKNTPEKPDFNNAIGLRFGSTTGLTYKHNFSAYNAMELIAGTQRHALSFTALYERNFLTNIEGLKLYAGGGAHIARPYYKTWGYSYNDSKDQFYYENDYRYANIIGLDIIGGFEYKFQSAPIAISFDFKPYMEFYKQSGPRYKLDPGAAIKYTF